MIRHQSVRDIAEVARKLGELVHEVVFLGGAAVPLLVPPAVVPTVRSTDDVDCVVRAETFSEYSQFGERLRKLGFQECRDEGAPICRWTAAGVTVDVMPTNEDVLGFSNRWHPLVIGTSEEVDVAPGVRVRVASLPAFLATKFEAFSNRGREDDIANADLEDIFTLLGSREDALERILAAPAEIRQYLVESSRKLLAKDDLDDVVSGCFDTGATSQAAVPRVRAILEELAEHPME